MYSAAFSPDGKRIVTASDDKTARIWDAATGKPIGEPLRGHEDGVTSAAFSPDGKRIVTASWTRRRGLGTSSRLRRLVGHAKVVIPRCLTPEQRKSLPIRRRQLVHRDGEVALKPAAWKQWLADVRAGKNPPLPANQ